MNTKMKVKENLFGIAFQIIVALVQAGTLIPIVHTKGISVNGKHIVPENGYFKIKWLKNVVWMHIQDGYGVFINEYVQTNDGSWVNLVEILSKYYWFIDNSFSSPRCSKLQNRELWRCIANIITYGDIRKHIPSYYEVHHKWWRWCNLQNTIRIVCEKKHHQFHEQNGQGSHRAGVVIDDANAFITWIGTIKAWNKYYRNVPM